MPVLNVVPPIGDYEITGVVTKVEEGDPEVFHFVVIESSTAFAKVGNMGELAPNSLMPIGMLEDLRKRRAIFSIAYAHVETDIVMTFKTENHEVNSSLESHSDTNEE